MDANAHMANAAYLHKCVDARMSFFKQHGFPVTEFAKRKIGPVVRRDELEYFREIALLEPITVTLELAGMAPDGSRFRLVNEIHKADGKLAARIRSEGGWMDLAARKLIAPPDDLREALAAMPHAAAFEHLPSSIRK
jgi:acyl-CoA thioester hydrolase